MIMAGIDLATAESRLSAYLAAEIKVLAGQSVQIDNQTLTRADLAKIQSGIDTWNARVIELSQKATGYGRARTVKAGW